MKSTSFVSAFCFEQYVARKVAKEKEILSLLKFSCQQKHPVLGVMHRREKGLLMERCLWTPTVVCQLQMLMEPGLATEGENGI